MRTRKSLVFIAALAIVAAIVIHRVERKPAPKPVAAVTILCYTNLSYKKGGDFLGARVMLVNNGTASMSLNLSPFDGTPYPSVGAETPSGWTNYKMGGMTASCELLRPGSNYVFTVWLPTNALRWKLSFYVSTASIRERAFWRMVDYRVGDPLFRVLEWPMMLLPGEPRERLKIAPNVFEIDDVWDRPHNEQRSS
jgi:hypothetical protein